MGQNRAGMENSHEHQQSIAQNTPNKTIQVPYPLKVKSRGDINDGSLLFPDLGFMLEDDSGDEGMLSILSRPPSPQNFRGSIDSGTKEQPSRSAWLAKYNGPDSDQITGQYRIADACPFCELSEIECNGISKYHTANGLALCSNYKLVVEPCEARAAKTCSFCKDRRILCKMTRKYRTATGEIVCSNFGGVTQPFEHVANRRKRCLSCKARQIRCDIIWKYNSAKGDVMCSACTVEGIKCVFGQEGQRIDHIPLQTSSLPHIGSPASRLIFDPVVFLPFATEPEHTTSSVAGLIHPPAQQASNADYTPLKEKLYNAGLYEDSNPKLVNSSCANCRMHKKVCDLNQKSHETTHGEFMCSRCTKLGIICLVEDTRKGFQTLYLPSPMPPNSAAKTSLVEEAPDAGSGTLASCETQKLARIFYYAGLGDSERVEPTYLNRSPYSVADHMPITKGKWWFRSEEELRSLSRQQRRRVMNAARIMETTLGEQRFGKDRCSKCEAQGYECWIYSDRGRAEVGKANMICARCRISNNGSCSFSARVPMKGMGSNPT